MQQRQAETDAQQKQAEQLRQQASSLRDAIVGPNSTALDQIEARAGLGAVTGDGVTVTLASGPAPTDPVTGKAQSTDQGHIVDFDLQVMSNELWHDGAEAIAINGQRLIATSTIRAAGNAILVDLAPLSEPYSIQAIGPSQHGRRPAQVGGRWVLQLPLDELRRASLRCDRPVGSGSPGRPTRACGTRRRSRRCRRPRHLRSRHPGPVSPGSGSTAPNPPASKSPPATPSPGGP